MIGAVLVGLVGLGLTYFSWGDKEATAAGSKNWPSIESSIAGPKTVAWLGGAAENKRGRDLETPKEGEKALENDGAKAVNKGSLGASLISDFPTELEKAESGESSSQKATPVADDSDPIAAWSTDANQPEPSVQPEKLEESPVASEPLGADARESQPAASEPLGADAEESQPVASEPLGADARESQPVGATEPQGADARESQPVASEPQGTDAQASQPVVTNAQSGWGDVTGEVRPEGDYERLNPEGPGHGTFKFISGQTDEQGRYILLLEFEGQLGAFKTNTYRSEHTASYVDFEGDYNFVQDVWPVKGAMVRQFRFGRHKDFTRLSLTYKTGQAPESAEAFVLKQGQILAVIFQFTGQKPQKLAQEAKLVQEPNLITKSERVDSQPHPQTSSSASSSSSNQGKFGRLKGQYAEDGGYVLGLEFTGELGEFKFNTDTSQEVVPTYIDFIGDYDFSQSLYSVPGGPILRFRLGRHPGFTRLSLTYRDNNAPKNANLNLENRDGRLVITYAFIGDKTLNRAKEAFKAGL
ncbi:MAG: hypothetical protein LBT38_02440 [Deltaproteobacteria bacterium]|nr:hypothetical protein [Deltaproteobacteria bacterium]